MFGDFHVMQNDYTSCVSTAMMSLTGVGYVNPVCERGVMKAQIRSIVDSHRTGFGSSASADAAADAACAAVSSGFGDAGRQMDAMAVYHIMRGVEFAGGGMFQDRDDVWLGQATPSEVASARSLDALMVSVFGERMRKAFAVPGGRTRFLVVGSGHAFGLTRVDGTYVKDNPAAPLLVEAVKGCELPMLPQHSAITFVCISPGAQLKSLTVLDEQHRLATGGFVCHMLTAAVACL